MAQNRFANLVNVAPGRKIHHRVGTEVDGCMQLLELLINVRGDGGISNVGVDLAQRSHTNAHRLQLRMVDVGRNNHAAARYFIANQFGRKFLAIRYILHFLRDHTLAGVVHLGEIAVMIFSLAAVDPLGSRPGNTAPVALVTVIVLRMIAVARITLCGSHVCHLCWILQKPIIRSEIRSDGGSYKFIFQIISTTVKFIWRWTSISFSPLVRPKLEAYNLRSHPTRFYARTPSLAGISAAGNHFRLAPDRLRSQTRPGL